MARIRRPGRVVVHAWKGAGGTGQHLVLVALAIVHPDLEIGITRRAQLLDEEKFLLVGRRDVALHHTRQQVRAVTQLHVRAVWIHDVQLWVQPAPVAEEHDLASQ